MSTYMNGVTPKTAAPEADRQSTTRSMLDLVEGQRWRIVELAASSLLGGVSEALFLILVTRAAFAISAHEVRFEAFSGHRLSVTMGVLIALALVIVRMSMAVLGSSLTASVSSEVVARTRRRLARGFLTASWPTQQSERTGQLQEMLTTFTIQASVLINNLILAIIALFSLLALLGLAVGINPGGAVVVIIGVVVLGSMLRPVRAAVRRRGRRSAAVGMHFATSLSEVSQLGLKMHVFHVQDQTEQRVLELIETTAVADRRLTFVKSLVPSLYTGFAYLALVGALAGVAYSKSASLMTLASVMLIMLRSLTYGQALQSNSAGMASTLPYLHTLEDQLEKYELGRQWDGGEPVGHVGVLDFANVSFAYEPGQPVLKNVTLSIGPSEVVGVVGPSGGGKSTLVQLLLGLREPDVGTVSADGRPICDLSKGEWARKVTFVPQELHLISGTISDNIRFLRDDVTQEDIERAARWANLYDEVERFPEGFDRQVGEQGGQLSGGQLQRLCIARALVEKPDVLILDEPTSALDMRSEQLIRETLTELKERMTIVIIAHRLSTLEMCERIMVIQDGEIKGFDTPGKLAETNDFYHEALVLAGLR